MSHSNSLHVLIAGGGVAGLALAVGLRHTDHRVTVVERRDADRPRDGNGLVLAPNGTKALAWLDAGMAAEVRDAGVASGGIGETGHRSAFVTASGSELGGVSFDGTEQRWGQPVVSIRRRDLLAILRDRARDLGAELLEGQAVRGFDQDADGVDLHADTTLRGDVLVGADGLRSPTRSALLGPQPPRYCGVCALRGFGPRPEERPDGFIAYGRGIVLFVSPVDDRQAYWVASVDAPRPDAHDDPAQTRTHVLNRMRAWHPDLRAIVEQSDPRTCIVTDVYDRDRAPTWRDGRVILVGDAAHPMIYTMGQGANVALEDAAVLVDALRGAEPVAALTAFEHARADRAAAIAAQSRTMGRVAHVTWGPLCALRNLMMRVMMRAVDLDRSNAEVFGWSPPQPPLG